MKKLCLLAVSLLALPALADNQQGFYVGGGATSIKDYQDGINNVSRIKAVELFGGYKYNGLLGAELRFGSGQSTGTSDSYVAGDGKVTSGSLEREIGSYTSIYYKPEMINEEAKLYALLGYTSVSTSVIINKNNAGKVSKSASGLSYGIGVGVIMDEHFNINVEYKNICDEISDKPNMVSVNLDYRF